MALYAAISTSMNVSSSQFFSLWRLMILWRRQQQLRLLGLWSVSTTLLNTITLQKKKLRKSPKWSVTWCPCILLSLQRGFCELWADNTLYMTVELLLLQKGTVLDSGGSQASFLMQAFTLTKRSFVNMSRDFGYYWLRLIIYIVVTICIGTIYFNVGTGYSSILVFSELWHVPLFP